MERISKGGMEKKHLQGGKRLLLIQLQVVTESCGGEVGETRHSPILQELAVSGPQ